MKRENIGICSSRKRNGLLNKKGLPAMGTYQPSPKLLRTNTGNHCCRRREVVLPELSEKASGGGRVRKDFRASYAYELRRASKYPPTLFSRQTLFPSFQRERRVSSESAQEGPAEPCQTSRNTRRLLLGSWWASVPHPAERMAPKQKTILTYYLLVWSTL